MLNYHISALKRSNNIGIGDMTIMKISSIVQMQFLKLEKKKKFSAILVSTQLTRKYGTASRRDNSNISVTRKTRQLEFNFTSPVEHDASVNEFRTVGT